MMRIVIGMTSAALLAACASTPPSPQEQILGNWTCKTDAEGVVVDGLVRYLPDGKGDGKVTVDVSQSGMGIKIEADVLSTWAFLADGKIEESVTKLTVTRGEMGGQDVPSAMIQPMIEEMIVGQKTVSTVKLDANTLSLTDEDGVTTNCTR